MKTYNQLSLHKVYILSILLISMMLLNICTYQKKNINILGGAGADVDPTELYEYLKRNMKLYYNQHLQDDDFTQKSFLEYGQKLLIEKYGDNFNTSLYIDENWINKLLIKYQESENNDECAKEFCNENETFRQCYRRNALVYHTDKGGDKDVMQKLNNCNEEWKKKVSYYSNV